MFPELTGNGRVWIYTSKRPLTPSEQEQITTSVNGFLSQWAAHGQSLKGAFNILHEQVLVLAVDEDFENATGCSIDSSIQVFRELDAKLGIDLFDRLNLGFLIADQLKLVRLAELNSAYQAGTITEESIFLDNAIGTLDQLRTSWKVPLKQSWAAKKIKQLA